MNVHPRVLASLITVVAIFAVIAGFLLSPREARAAIVSYSATNDAGNVTYILNYSSSYTYRRVYIDTDQNSATGYLKGPTGAQIGAEFLLEQGTLYRRANSSPGSDWSWTSVKTVNYSDSGARATWIVARSDIGETANPNGANLMFEVESPLATSPKVVHTYSSPSPTPTRTRTPTPTARPPGMTVVTYTVTANTNFANPERGFYHDAETHSTGYTLLDLNTLKSYRTVEGISLILRLWYMEDFRNSDISASYLNNIQADFTTIRAAGLKAIVRFAYTQSSTAPYGDAPKTIVLRHISQLTPVLRANADVIATVQTGFIGAWGEWYYTDYFGDQGNISTAQWADRKQVHEALLNALPSSRTAQLRTPKFKAKFYGASALTSAEAFSNTFKARTGHHNDCFLSDATDQGTYANSTDKAYLAVENRYVPQGGETCAVSTFSVWSNANQDMNYLRYSYLNRDYHPDVLASWGSNIEIAKRKLGYRFNLVSGSYSNVVKPGTEFNIRFGVVNSGYATPFNAHQLMFIARNQTTGKIWDVNLNVDVRRWLSSTSAWSVVKKICAPSTMPAGNYDLLLNLRDPSLPTRPEYSIRFANANTWESSKGNNRLLHYITVTNTAPNPACSSSALVLVGH